MWIRATDGTLHNLDYARSIKVQSDVASGPALDEESKHTVEMIQDGDAYQIVLTRPMPLSEAQVVMDRIAAAMNSKEYLLDLTKPERSSKGSKAYSS